MVTSGVRESSLSKLLTFAFQPAFDSDHSIAEVIFWGNLIRDGAPHEVQWLMDSEDANIKYNAWFLFDWDFDGQGSVAELFLEDQSTRLDAAERQFLARLLCAHLRLYEVESVQRGEGVYLHDLWTGSRLFVTERAATARMATWDLMGARVAPDGRGGNIFEGGLYQFPAEAKPQVLTHFKRLQRRHRRKHPDDDIGTFFRKHGMVFHHLWLNLVAFPEPPKIVTSEGDPLMFCRVVFDLGDRDEVRRALLASVEVRSDTDDGPLLWREPGADGERLLGTWELSDRRIVLETTSQERAVRGRAWLEALVGEHVRYRATALETVEQTMASFRRQRPMKPIDPPPPAEAGVVRELYDRHYRTWLDRPDPGLGQRTPRAAARTSLWRAQLIERLKQMENAAERAALQGRPGYDFHWIWTALGLERQPVR